LDDDQKKELKMKPVNLIISAFALVALAQLFVPWQMISKQSGFAESGVVYKFKIDAKIYEGDNRPGATIRGKFIWLNFEADNIKIADKKEWTRQQSAYVKFTSDSLGFVKIASVTRTKPANSIEWVRARAWIPWKDTTSLHLEYPFNRYYIKDTNPREIESIIKNGLGDSLKVNYLDVRIRENQFFVNDLLIDGVSFKEKVAAATK
jgi:hypothetical protein